MPTCPSARPGAGMCTICAKHKREVRLKGFTKVYKIHMGTDPTILKVKEPHMFCFFMLPQSITISPTRGRTYILNSFCIVAPILLSSYSTHDQLWNYLAFVDAS